MKIEVNINKKYFFILLGVLIIIAGIIGVYAVLGTTPNPGHAVTGLQTCSANEILKMNSAGTAWTCATLSTTPTGTITTDAATCYEASGGTCLVGGNPDICCEANYVATAVDGGGDVNVIKCCKLKLS